MKIDESVYQKICFDERNSLIGRVTLLRGESSWKYDDLKNRLQDIWKTFGQKKKF